MKDIHEVQAIQPHPFNHVRCRGVAAKARSVYLSIDKKLGHKGGTRTHQQQHHPVSQGTMPLKPHSAINAIQPNPPHNDGTYYIGGYLSNVSSSQTVPAIPPGSLNSLTGRPSLEVSNAGAQQRSKATGSRGHTNLHLLQHHCSRKSHGITAPRSHVQLEATNLA